MKKLFTLLAVFAITSFYSAKADWIKNVQLASYDFTLAPSPAFTTASSNLSGNNTSGATTVPLSGTTGGYMWSGVTSGSGGRGTKITNMTATTARTDTVYYEFDWNPYSLGGQANSTGTAGINPNQYGICVVRGVNDSIVFGLWYERWSLKDGTTFNTSTGTQPLGDLHLMNISTDVNNPIPPKVITQTNPTTLATWSYYTNILIPFAMLDQNVSTNYYAAKCDSINQSTDLGPTFKMNLWYHIKAVIDFQNKKIISFDVTQTGSTPENKRSFTNLPFVHTGATDVSRLEIATPRGNSEGGTSGGTANFEQRFDNFDIYNMRQVAAAANVTIRYKDATGTEIKAARVIPNLEVSAVCKAIAGDKINIIYGGDFYTYDLTSVDSVTVATGGSEINLRFIKATPKSTVVSISGPATAELYHDVTVNFTVKTPTGDVVSQGPVNILVSGVLKNTFVPDALGMGSVTFPNLLVGTENIKAVYVGDRIAYNSSDTVGVSVEITPSLSSEIPYPVYYDLGTMPEIMKYRLKYTTASTARLLTTAFASDSLKSVTLSTDTTSLTKTMYVTYYTAAFTVPGKTADYYGASDEFIAPYGNGTSPSWMSFKTPWLNKGAYNVYMNQRTNLDAGMKTTATMDGKTFYYPNAELSGYSIRGANNNKRRWNANANDALNQMSYLGSVILDASGQHVLKLTCTSTTESTSNQIAWLDMMEFIPVDQDSVNVNISAAAGLAKTYFPLFNSGGYASNTTATFIVYANSTELAVPFQVTDPTTYTKTSYTLQHLGVTDPNLGLTGVDHVVIFKKDKWTRVSEGVVNSDSTYTCDLANGDYYYQEFNYTESSTTLGALGTRLWMKDGVFTVGNPDAVINPKSTNIRTYAVDKTLTVKGIKAGAKIMVTDLLGRLMLNAVSTSDVFTSTMKQGSVYIVKVISGNDNYTTKLIVK